MYRPRVHSGTSAKAPTRDDVARKANISGATVSRVLSGRTDFSIAPETRDRVLKAAQQLGYRPNTMARALIGGRTGLVGFWMSLDYSRYRGQVLDYMGTLVNETELTLAITDVDKEFTSRHTFDRALRVPVDGIIAFDNSASVEAFAMEYDHLVPGTPFVSMGAYWTPSHSYVGIDLLAGANAAMHHLLSSGRRRIAYMAPSASDLINSGPRYEAYVSKMNTAGLTPSTIPVTSVSYHPVLQALGQCMEDGPLPEAILCMNDDIAIAAAFVLKGLGIEVGPDIALVGFDGIEEAEHCPVPITTVRQPIAEMCDLAWQFLNTQIDDPASDLQQRVLTPELIIRDSTRT